MSPLSYTYDMNSQENLGRSLKKLHEDTEVCSLKRFQKIDFSLVDEMPGKTSPANAGDESSDCRSEGGKREWWRPPYLLPDNKARLDNFRTWLVQRPERVICVTAHGHVFQQLLSTNTRMINCKFMIVEVDKKGTLMLSQRGEANALTIMHDLAALPLVPRQIIDYQSSINKKASVTAGGCAAKRMSRRERKILEKKKRKANSAPKPKLVLLVGLPGSGKSTFVNALLRRNCNHDDNLNNGMIFSEQQEQNVEKIVTNKNVNEKHQLLVEG